MSSTKTEVVDNYRIRKYDPGDRDDFLSLYDLVLGDGGTDEWFEWKFVRNPYADDVPMFVAEHEGQLVGTRPYLAFRVRIGDRVLPGVQTCDTMVHPDHRRKGLFTRMTERSFDYYSTFDEPVLKFSIPNDLSRPGYLKLGCRTVAPLTTYYRIQSPGAMVGGNDKLKRVAAATEPIATVYNKARDLVASVDAGVDVVRHEDVPVDEFVSLYESAIPNRIHALRDRDFYRWRFTNPHWSYRAYTARSDGEPVAGVVTGRRDDGAKTAVQLTEVVPLLGANHHREALAALLSRILADNADADLISVSGPTIPHDLLSSFGFHPDGQLPLSAVATQTILITKLLDGRDDARWIVGGEDLLDPASWHLSYSEHNTS